MLHASPSSQTILGFGASGPLALPTFSEARFEAVIEAAIAGGICHFDTADFYAGGIAVSRLAKCLDRLEARGAIDRATLTIATKIGKKITKPSGLVRDFGRDAIEEALDRHCRLFGGRAPDIVYMHGPDEKELYHTIPILQSLKRHGMLRAVGVCTDGPSLAAAAGATGVDVVMGRYNFLDTTAGVWFRQARDAGKKTVAIAPLGQALWRRSLLMPRTPRGLWYLARALRRQPGALLKAQIADWFRSVEDWSAVDLALAFARTGPVDVVLTTSGSPTHVRELTRSFDRHVSEEICSLLNAHRSG